MQQRKNAALRWLWLSLAAALVIPSLLFAYLAYASYQQAFVLADERIDRALAVSAEQALRIFRSIDVTLDSVDQITRGRTEAAIAETAPDLTQRLKQFTRAFPDISSIWVLDRNGDAIVSSLFYPIPPSFNAPERSYLKAELADGDEICGGDGRLRDVGIADA